MTNESHTELRKALWPNEDDIPVKLLECRHCGQRNRVQVPRAVLEPSRCECGTCRRPLFLSPEEPLTGITSSTYEHSLDRSTLAALKAIPGFPAMIRWLQSNLGERSLRLLSLSSSVMCGEDQFPELLKLLERSRHRLDFSQLPTLFLTESPYANAATFGTEEPAVIVYAGLLDQLNDREVMAVLGHELGHLHAEHGLYQTVGAVLASGSSLLGTVGQLLSFPLQKALYKWMRCSELTADRAGLLACRDLGASLNVLLKLAGGHRPGITQRTQIRMAPFVRQARTLAKLEEGSWFDGLLAMILTMNKSHPFIAWRVMHLLEWVEQGNYLEILAGHYERNRRPLAA